MIVYTLPFIAALIGWFTNYLAVKMLFHPKEPVKVLFVTFHGLFPKRQRHIAEKIGKLVADELLSFDDIRERLATPENFQSVRNTIGLKVDEFLYIKFPEMHPLVSLFMGDDRKDRLKEQLLAEVDDVAPKLIDGYIDNVEKDLDVEELVKEKMAAFEVDKLEKVLFDILNEEFKFIEIAGAVLGFFVGCVQLGLLKLTGG